MPGISYGQRPAAPTAPAQKHKTNGPTSGPTLGPPRAPPQPPQPLPRQRPGAPTPDPRRVIVDHIIRDCYSKLVVVDGRKVPEIKYNTHVLIREYSLYPQQAPPADLLPAQIGLVKSRILVVCTKHTGRVLLQKGKYNEQKRVYQIGRTWDLDELTCVAREANDAFVLLLNKDYYWKSGDEAGRLHKFVHHLAVIYHRFTGHYPQMRGFTLESLGLGLGGANTSSNSNLSGTGTGTGNGNAITSSLEKRMPLNISSSTLTAEPTANAPPLADLYKDMDFTVNGTLPVKSMQVMDVDRPAPAATLTSTSTSTPTAIATPASTIGTSTRRSTESSNPKSLYDAGSVSTKDSLTKAPTASIAESPEKTTADITGPSTYLDGPSVSESQGSFAPPDTPEDPHKSMPTILEYAQQTGLQLPLRNYKPERENIRPREASDNLETAASYGLQFENQLHGLEDQQQQPAKETTFRFEVPQDAAALESFNDKVDNDADSIEEASISESSIDTQAHGPMTSNSMGVRKDSVIDDSIRDIEDFMVTQFGKEQDTPDPETPLSKTVSHSRSPSKALARKLLEPFRLADDEYHGLEHLVHEEDAIFEPKQLQIPEKVVEQEPESNLQHKKPQNTASALNEATPEPEAEVKLEKDPEIEELLDEIGWNPTDGSELCIKLLKKELAAVKHRNVSELTTLDFGKDTLANEVKISSGEINNLVEIFKRMEVSFKMIAPQISNIERNSKGLQVEAVNKKILYNELNETMKKIRLNDRDLDTVANYKQFDDLSMVPILEGKLLMLYDALGAIDNKTSDENLRKMHALKQFHETYESVSLSFVRRFLSFITAEFKRVVEELNRDVANILPQKILSSLGKQYVFAGVNIFVKCISERDFIAINDKFNAYLANFLENILSSRTKAIYSGNTSARNSRLAYNSESLSGLKKHKSSRFGSTRILGRISGVNGDQTQKQIPVDLASKAGDEINDARTIIQLAKESSEFMLVVQYFLGTFFHLTSEDEFSTFLNENPFKQRMDSYGSENIDSINYKTNSNELLRNMNAIFGNYINKFTREITPSDLITTQVLVGLFELLAEAESTSQDFVAYSFLEKLAEKYKTNWERFIANQVDLFNKSDVRAKGGILPAVRNLNQIITMVETSIQDSQSSQLDLSEVNLLIVQTYVLLTKAAGDLFNRDDPLLKSNTHDEKERAYRNVAILQNLYSILQQLGEYDSSTTASMTTDLGEIFKCVEQEYFDYIVRMHIGRISEFVNGHSAGEQKNKSKKEDKILVRGISSSHTSKEMSVKITEMLKKMEKHVISSDTVFEHDLLDLMWKDLEEVVEGVFRDFHNIARTVDRDIEESVSGGEIRRLFNRERPFKQ